ncbi:MAG: hypothetical protein ACRDJU_15230, partial [Actinomycetota bacterium]
SGSGCTPSSPVTVDAGAKVTATATADDLGEFHAQLKLPSSLGTGRYDLVAQCGAVLTGVVDIGNSSSNHVGLDIVLIVVGLLVAFGLGVSISRLMRLRKPANPSDPG